MIQLYEFPYSPFAIVQRRLMDFGGIPFKSIKVSNADRSAIWKLTKGEYYQIPVLKDGRKVIFESGDFTQDIATHLDQKFDLGVFPKELGGIQEILWTYVEDEVEGVGFKLNDAFYREFVPKADVVGFVRHKERKFGKGCLDQWRDQRSEMLTIFEEKLRPFEAMLETRKFLLTDRLVFLDFDLYGIIGNALWTGKNRLPSALPKVRAWYRRMKTVRMGK